MRKVEHFAEFSSTNIQTLSNVPEKNSSKTTLDKFLTVLTTWQIVCRSSKKSTLKVRKKLQKNLFKTTCLPQQIPWTRSSFGFPAKLFCSEFEIHSEIFFSQTTLLLENVTLETYHAILPTALKNCHESSKYFLLQSRN